jgi:hypothetical protein
MAVDSERNQDVLVGTKPRAQVEAAYQRLEHKAAAPGLRTPFSLGAVAAYEWALGRAALCVVQLGDPTQSAEGAAHARGVHDALAWVCGLIDERP